MGRSFKEVGVPAITLVIAVLGAVTGTISFIRSQDVSVTIVRATYQPQVRPHVLTIAAINNSFRATNITGGWLSLNGQKFAQITRVLPDPKVLTNANLSSRDLARWAAQVPYSIAAQGTFDGALVWKVIDIDRPTPKWPTESRPPVARSLSYISPWTQGRPPVPA